MERRVSYLLVGLFSLLMVMGLIAFVLWANHRHSHGHNQAHYLIYFDHGVNGLNLGSGVRYLGVEVGQVTAIDIDTDNRPLRVSVEVGINSKIPISNGDLATMKPSGITGVYFIDIRHGDANTPPLTKDADGMTIIPSELSSFDQLLSSGGDTAKKLEEAITRVNALLSDTNLDHIAHTFGNIDQTTTSLTAHNAELGDTLRELSQAAKNLNALLDSLRKQGIDRDAAAMVHAGRDAAENLSALSRSLRDNPSRLIFPNNAKGVEVKP